jgi:hypothetical protein
MVASLQEPWQSTAINSTGTALWTQALDYADMTNSQFPNTALQLQYVNNALSKMHYHLANGDNAWFAETATVPVTPGAYQFALPDGAHYVRSDIDPAVPVKFYRLTKLLLNVSNREYEIPKLYRHEQYGFTKTPLVAGNLDMLYVPEFAPLAAMATNIDTTYPAGWEDYVAWIIAKRLLMREESVEAAAMADSEAKELLAEMDRAVASRDSSYPQRIEDTTGRWQWTRRWLLARNYENNYSYTIEGQNLIIVEPAILP